MKELNISIPAFAILLFLGCFVISYIIIPKIISVVKQMKILDTPNIRSSHTNDTPTLGGIALFIICILGIFFISFSDTENMALNIIVGITIIFFVGLKDDISIINPITKLLAQLIAFGFILYNSDFIISNLQGFLGIESLSKFISYPLTFFVVIVIINAYNLIDGVDGLAIIIGSVISFTLGIIFNYLELYFYAYLCVIVLGFSISFLRYNLSTGNNKIFMGDTGSLIIGFLISVLTIRFLCVDDMELQKLPFKIKSIPITAMSILIIPLIDTARVFTIRVINKKSPFEPDKKHIHHIFLRLGLNHLQTSIFIGIINIFFIIFFLFINYIYSSKFIILIFTLLIIILLFVFWQLDFKFSIFKKKNKKIK